MPIEAPPTPVADPSPVPTRADPVSFSPRMDTFLGWLVGFRSWLISVAANVWNNAGEAFVGASAAAGSASAATVSAAASAASAQASAASAGASQWVAGTYAINDRRWSPITRYVYRCILAGASSTDPANDATRWALDSVTDMPVLMHAGVSPTAVVGAINVLANPAASTITIPAMAVGDRVGVACINGRYDNTINPGTHAFAGFAVGEVLTMSRRNYSVTITNLGPASGLMVGNNRATAAYAQSLVLRLAAATASTVGYVGAISSDSFGVNWIRRPIMFDGVSGTAAAADNDNGAVSKYGGTEGAGWVRIFFGLSANGSASGLFTAGTSTLVANRVADLVKMLRFWHGLGRKVLLVLDGPITTASADMTLYRDRLEVLLRFVNPGVLRAGTQYPDHQVYIDAVEPQNEPYGPMLGAGGTFFGNPSGAWAKLAELQRVTHRIFKALSPRTIVCTAPFQGGETAAVEAVLAASAVGVSVRGDGGGTGTRGEMFIDVLTYHPYDNAATVAEGAENFTQARTERVIRSYSSWIQTAVANRRLDVGGGGAAWWAGKPDPECWATELNVSPHGGNITSNTEFRMSAYTLAQRKRHMQAVLLGSFAAGYAKVFPYAPDHVGDQGPWTPAAQTTAANGIDVRMTSSPGKCFDGDIVLSYASGVSEPLHGVAANASSDGSAFDIVGVLPSYTLTYQTLHRFLLGGWHEVWPELQAELTGEVESGFYPTSTSPDTHQPQYRRNRGFVRRVVAGVLTNLEV